MNWNKLILIVLCAAIAFGGTFTCKSETRHDEPSQLYRP